MNIEPTNIEPTASPQTDHFAADATPLAEGLIIDGSRGHYHVETAAGVLLCTIRGRLRKQLVYPTSTSGRKSVQQVHVKDHDPVAVGDRVRVRVTGSRTGVVEEVIARAGGAITRDDPHPGHGTLRAVAGVDQMIAVFAAREPAPHLRMLDRFLALAEAQELGALVCINKADLGIAPWLAERLAVYRAIGYPVLETSAASGDGLEALRATLGGRTSAFVGPSGVGKSSLLNAVQPELGQRVSAVSGSSGKGRHTTTGARLVPLDDPAGGYIADTAGIRALGLGEAITERLDWCFRELRPYLTNCHLSDCGHLHEPGCAVRAALAAGAIDRQRYDSYCRLRRGDGVAGATEGDAQG